MANYFSLDPPSCPNAIGPVTTAACIQQPKKKITIKRQNWIINKEVTDFRECSDVQGQNFLDIRLGLFHFGFLHGNLKMSLLLSVPKFLIVFNFLHTLC